MAYFNHAFSKTFFAGGAGYINAAGETSVSLLGTHGAGAITFADQASAGMPSIVAPAAGQPLTLLATSLMSSDKIGPFHGGYQETTKSKMINPKFINKFYRTDSAAAVSNMIGIGSTPNLTSGLAAGTCVPSFYCDETYHLRLDVKGSPVLAYLNRNLYNTLDAYTGCCDGPIPTLVDPVSVMASWMAGIVNDPILNGQSKEQRLVNVGVTATCDEGVTWDLYLPANEFVAVEGIYFAADGTTLNAVGTAFAASTVSAGGQSFASVRPITAYVSTFTPATPNCTGGIVLESAYMETKFGNCTFQPSDNYEIEPLIMQASMLDESGDTCTFDHLCVSDGISPSSATGAVIAALRPAVHVMGTGESVLRDLILSQSYEQNNVSTDLRIREVTNGNDIVGAVDRNALYTVYNILHVVPRYNNASGTFDNDQYLLCIPMTGIDTDFEAFVNAWLTGANNPVQLETI